MIGLSIKTESLPQRCEICHQSDCFVPETNCCSRWLSAEIEFPMKLATAISIENRALQMIYYLSGSLGIIVGYLVCRVMDAINQTVYGSSFTFNWTLLSLIYLMVGW